MAYYAVLSFKEVKLDHSAEKCQVSSKLTLTDARFEPSLYLSELNSLSYQKCITYYMMVVVVKVYCRITASVDTEIKGHMAL